MAHYVLGISCYYHDAAACLLKDGEIIAAAHEERFTRKKHDQSFPRHAIDFCLSYASISDADLAMIGFYEKPFLKFDRIISTFLATWPRGAQTFLRVIPRWIRERLWTKNHIKKQFPGYKGEIAFIEHHLSHAASSFYSSPYENAAVLTMDGVGEWTTASWGVGTGTDLQLNEEMRFPHSLGLLYSTITAFLGFEVNEGEYKVMGLAPYGKPIFLDSIRSIACLNEDGSLWLDMRYFAYQHGQASFGRKLVELLGTARAPESPFEPRHYDIAASIQKFCEGAMVRLAEHVWNKTHAENLCLAGGVALNCVGNSEIKKRTKFKNVFVQPASGDAGGAIGVAQYMWHMILGNPRRDGIRMPYWGTAYSDGQVREFLRGENLEFRELAEADLIREVADLLAREKVVGWFQGRMEFGPRALGCRSILGDPRPPHMRETVNQKIKFRESFRPFAPAVLKEKANEWFEINFESPYMLFTAPAHESQAPRIPAVTHVDRSARVQTVARDDNRLFYDLIHAFGDKTGVPILLNTSFNRRGEPIVESPRDAYNCFMGSGIDVLVLNRFIIEKK